MGLAGGDEALKVIASGADPNPMESVSDAVHSLDHHGIPVELAASAGRRTRLRRLFGLWQSRGLAMFGPRFFLLPRRVRATLRASVIDTRAARRLVASLDSLDTWHTAWTAFADEAAARGDVRTEIAALGVARMSLAGSVDPRDRVIVERMRARYLERDDHHHIEAFTVSAAGTEASALLQLPDGAMPASGWPVVLVQAGIGEAKERSHRLANRALERGFACVRVDMPDLGATCPPGLAGVVEATIDLLAADPRLDASDVHLFGSCFAGALVIDGAVRRPESVRSVTAISSWYHYEPTSELLPPTVLEYVVAGFELERDANGRVIELPDDLSLRGFIGGITCPVRLHHGALDLVTTARETIAIGAELDPARTQTRIYAFDGHGCLRHRDAIELEFLELAAECSRRRAGATHVEPELRDAA